MKNWPTAQPTTINELQTSIAAFVDAFSHQRPHRSLDHRATPATAYQARPKADSSADRSRDTHRRVLFDSVDTHGKLSLRLNGRCTTSAWASNTPTQVLKVVDGLHVRIINAPALLSAAIGAESARSGLVATWRDPRSATATAAVRYQVGASTLLRRILPVGPFGRLGTNQIRRGYL